MRLATDRQFRRREGIDEGQIEGKGETMHRLFAVS